MYMCEEDIPGAYLKGRRPEQFKVPELKLWLTCRGAPTKGKKADLVEMRIVVGPRAFRSVFRPVHVFLLVFHAGSTLTSSMGGTKFSSTPMDIQSNRQARILPLPSTVHFLLTVGSCSSKCVKVRMQCLGLTMVSYFVTRSVIDGLPSGDFKSINSSAENLFRCGHIRGIEICPAITALYIRASCLPEMRKDRVYNMSLALNQSCDITYASCGCPAGMGPSGSCKHIGALCYAFSDFCKSGSTPEFLTCTDKLQSWNKPQGRKVDPIPVEQLYSMRSELTKKGQGNVVYDPRPVQFRN